MIRIQTQQIARWAALIGALLIAGPALAQAPDTSIWDGYLDFAYVYSSADTQTLSTRIDQYSNEAGMTLSEYVSVQTQAGRLTFDDLDDTTRRRVAVAYLLQYLAEREPRALEHAVEAITPLGEQTGRHENMYWSHYIQAHRALEKGNAGDFTDELLALWLDVVVPLESPYDTLQALSLSQSAHSGFVAALPYVFENLSRMILIRSQEMGLNRDLDPLGSVVRMLNDGRVGAHPEVIPAEASSKEYLDRIVDRLDGPESDGGSLTFTLVLFEAGKYHDRARGLLADEGLSDATIKAIGVTSGAYETALGLADTLQGESAVYMRVLRQMGEIYAAKQRLGVDPHVETPFTVEGAINVYADLHASREGDRFAQSGFQTAGRDMMNATMRRLWEEIQETCLNAADYYLTRSQTSPALADEHIRNAARMYARYLAFFDRFSTEEGAEYVPDSAYFASYEAGRGYGDAYIAYPGINPNPTEIEHAVSRYANALSTFPFDRTLWPALTAALERQGRSNEYLPRARPVADRVARSRYVASWIESGEPGTETITIFRNALSDELVVMYLGFADSAGMGELEASVDALEERIAQVESNVMALSGEGGSAGPASPSPDERPSVAERAERQRQLDEAKGLLGKLQKQLAARQRALPLYRSTIGTEGLIDDLRSQRNHPVHTLLRRMYYEARP
jgi:hypothetical protein